ncbi:MAG: site-specific DNA-methyltransferase [Nanoarchaeota archaeon]|nr:site-specific DNA-methyltransferase [Nanoarchaeota archaeon]
MKELPLNQILQGDALSVLKGFPDDCIDCCITSPPYYALRQYGTNPLIFGGSKECNHEFNIKEIKDPMDRGGNGDHDREGGLSGTKIDYENYRIGYCKKCNAWQGQMGLEPTPQEYINHIVEIVNECMRVLKPTGVMFLNLGDSYGSHRSGKDADLDKDNEDRVNSMVIRNAPLKAVKSKWFKEKQKLLIPHRIAIALQELGFWIRDDITWAKKILIYPDKESIGSTMPFPCKDKLLPATEYIFQITKSPKYYFDLSQVKTRIKQSTIERASKPISSTYTNQLENNPYVSQKGMDAYYKRLNNGFVSIDEERRIKIREDITQNKKSFDNLIEANPTNAIMFKRMNQHSKKEIQEHFASFPLSLAEFFIKIGVPLNGVVLDPFIGSGTVGIAALQNGRRFIGIELSEKFINLANRRLKPYLEQKRIGEENEM